MSSSVQFISADSEVHVGAIAALAHDIWYEYYVPLLGRAQVDYMVSRFQSVAAMRKQVGEGFEYFMMRRHDALVGYFAVQALPAEHSLFISKLYIQRSARGSGTGRLALEFIEGLARQRGMSFLWLTVNKGNPAVRIYEKCGFSIAKSLVIDIGGGFVMDDFRMEKSVNPLSPV